MAKKIPENKLWPIVKEGLERKDYGYICSNLEAKSKKLQEGFISMGIGGIQADVIGFKDTGTFRQPKLEVIAVEVKPLFENYRQREIDQAKRASLYAHKCFFAAPREFKSEEIEKAVKSGIGLFQIKNRKIKLIAPAVLQNPEETNVIRLMDRLGYFKCTICDCYWNRSHTKYANYYPRNYFFSKKSQKNFSKFICEVCKDKLYKMFSPRLRKTYVEEYKIERLRKRQERSDKHYAWLEQRLQRKFNKLEKQLINLRKRI